MTFYVLNWPSVMMYSYFIFFTYHRLKSPYSFIDDLFIICLSPFPHQTAGFIKLVPGLYSSVLKIR